MLTRNEARTLRKSNQWYLCRNGGLVKCWNATTTEITRHHGGVGYRGNGDVDGDVFLLFQSDCRIYFGFCPKYEGLVYAKKQANGKWKMQTIKLAFSD